MKNTLETKLGIFFALALVAAFIIMEMVGGADFLRGGLRVHALFNSVQELKLGDPVKMAGVQIGRVEQITLTNNQVQVTLKLDRRRATEVKTDSKAVVKFLGLLGQNYVSIGFGVPTAPSMEEGGMLTTAEQTDFSTLMAKLEDVAAGVQNATKSLSGDNFNNLLGPFNDFLEESRQKLTNILRNLENISTQIAKGEGTVGKLISDDALYQSALGAVTNLNETASDVKMAVNQAKSVMEQINQGQGTIGKLVRDETLYKETTTAMSNLKEILQKINQGQGSVGKLVNDDSLIKNAKVTLQKLDKATEGLEDQGPLSVLGIMVPYLF